MSRYKELIELVRDLRPFHIIEIGTWNGQRAAQMMGVSNAFYTGFDLFEEATQETNKAEMNVKAASSMLDVAKSIESAGFTRFALIRGNTRETLPAYFQGNPERFDFAFIDGGHSEETILSDFKLIYENIDPGGTIVLDDYYEPALEGFGCNFLLDRGELMEGSDPTVMKRENKRVNTRLLMVKK